MNRSLQFHLLPRILIQINPTFVYYNKCDLELEIKFKEFKESKLFCKLNLIYGRRNAQLLCEYENADIAIFHETFLVIGINGIEKNLYS